jgi:hypothetical protein
MAAYPGFAFSGTIPRTRPLAPLTPASRGGVKLAPDKDALELEQAELFVY